MEDAKQTKKEKKMVEKMEKVDEPVEMSLHELLMQALNNYDKIASTLSIDRAGHEIVKGNYLLLEAAITDYIRLKVSEEELLKLQKQGEEALADECADDSEGKAEDSAE